MNALNHNRKDELLLLLLHLKEVVVDTRKILYGSQKSPLVDSHAVQSRKRCVWSFAFFSLVLEILLRTHVCVFAMCHYYDTVSKSDVVFAPTKNGNLCKITKKVILGI